MNVEPGRECFCCPHGKKKAAKERHTDIAGVPREKRKE